MTNTIRIIDTGLAPARWNVAMTAALVRLHGAGETPDTVRFHRYPACVLIGHGQRLSQTVDLTYCRRRGIEIARRVTGGGAVFMSPRMLAWDVVLRRRGSHADSPEGLTRVICEAVAASLARLGASARFEPPNSITLDGAKISGSSGYLDGPSAVLQGTVLIEDDTSNMAAALGMSDATVRQRVSCLAASLQPAPTLADVQSALASGVASRLQRTPVPAQPSNAELALADKLLCEEMGSEDYVAGNEENIAVETVP
jgi:lipoate---protein ligase